MLILTIRSDKPEAELGLYKDGEQIAYETWEAHRTLAETIHEKIAALLESHEQSLEALGGIVVFKGPGSFTGLRIGLTVANALAAGLGIAVVASDQDTWIQTGIARLTAGENERIAMPEYGAPVHITTPRK